MSKMGERPNESTSQLTVRDYENIDHFFRVVLTRHAAGALHLDTAIGSLAHVISCLDSGNIDEARRWFEEGADPMGSEFLSS